MKIQNTSHQISLDLSAEGPADLTFLRDVTPGTFLDFIQMRYDG